MNEVSQEKRESPIFSKIVLIKSQLGDLKTIQHDLSEMISSVLKQPEESEKTELHRQLANNSNLVDELDDIAREIGFQIMFIKELNERIQL